MQRPYFSPLSLWGPPSCTDLLWSILNDSALALLDKTQSDNATEYEDCWMCFSASPAFYEGIALFGNFTLFSDANQLCNPIGGTLGTNQYPGALDSSCICIKRWPSRPSLEREAHWTRKLYMPQYRGTPGPKRGSGWVGEWGWVGMGGLFG
ncbi:mCG1027461 [Mus musculus]|nr:mCG1027461 [Mus musculus]